MVTFLYSLKHYKFLFNLSREKLAENKKIFTLGFKKDIYFFVSTRSKEKISSFQESF